MCRSPPVILLVLFFMAGCASTHMQQYLGKDIREVVMDSGPPENVLDLGDGRRAFQFYWGGGSFLVPPQ